MADEVVHGKISIPGQHVIAQPLEAIPDNAWVTLGIGDLRITQSPVEQARVKSIIQYFLEDNPGTDVNFALTKIAYMLNSLGQPQIGLNRLDQMYKYVTIQRNIPKKK